MNIVNVWKTKLERKKNPKNTIVYNYCVGQPVFTLGEFRIFNTGRSYIHTYKNIAIAELVGCNKELVKQIHDDERPVGKYNSSHFLFDRAKNAMTEYAEHIL